MQKQVKVVRKILFEELLTGSVDLDKTSERIVSALFFYPKKYNKDEKIDLPDLRARNRALKRLHDRKTH